MARRFIGDREVKRARRTKNGKILAKLLDPVTQKTSWEQFTPEDYERQVRREQPEGKS